MKVLQSKRIKKFISSNLRTIVKWNALILICCAILAYYCTAQTYSNPFYHPIASANYTLQNIGILFIILEAVFALCLKSLQGGAYWFSWLQLKKPSLDERQKAVRQRVFERSYAIAVAVLFIALPSAFLTISKYAEPARTDFATHTSWLVLILFVSLPSILASWQKDS